MKPIITFLLSLVIVTGLFAQPTITAFSPTSGAIGSSVTITGTHFNTNGAQDVVFFGATRATVTAATATSLTVTVPLGATYQYLSVTNLAAALTAYSAKPFIVTLSGSTNFIPKMDLATGPYPYSVSIGDLDGDGRPDLAVANYGSATVSVLLNTSTPGNVSFAAKVDLATGNNPYSVSIGDLDGDGKPDLAVANSGSNTVSVFLNTSTPGNISFAAKVDLPTGNSPWSVSIGDLDGDGRPDLAVANSNSNTVSVLRNSSTLGNISFAGKVDLTTGNDPQSVSIGDLDGDGKPDLAVTNGSATVSVFRNTSTAGNIGFAGNVDFATYNDPYSVSIGDLDGDGKPDLAVTNYISGTVSVLRNTSTAGNVSFAGKVDLATDGQPTSASIGDLDGDGKPDLAVTYVSAKISVLKNSSTSGNVSFAAKVDFATGSWPTSVSIGDVDGDGKPDLVVANSGSSTVSVIQQQCTATTINSTSMAGQTKYVGGTFTPITVNATGTWSLNYQWYSNATNSNTGGTSLSTNNGAQTNSYTPQTTVAGTLYYYCVVTCIKACEVPQTTSVSGAFLVIPLPPPTITAFSPASGAIGSSVTITGTNFNTTGAQDIVFFGATRATVTAATATSLTVTVPLGATYQYLSVTNLAAALTAYSAKPFIVTLSGSTGFIPKMDLATGSGPKSVTVGDLDGDGKPDLAVANSGSGTVSVFRNTSTPGSVSFAAKVDLATSTNPVSISIGDLDGDGKPDLAVANSGSATVSVFLNTSTPGSISFAAKVDLTTGTTPVSVSIGDLDGDGRPDLAVANSGSATVSVLKNSSTLGNISFAGKMDLTTGTTPYSVSIGDLDGDGKPDLAVANSGSATVSVLRNTSTAGNVGFAGKVDLTTGTNPYSVSIGDLDGDGKPDLAVANFGSTTVSVLKNSSTTGNVGFAAKVDLATGGSPYSVSIGDVDGDGKPDLVVANSGSSTVSVIQQQCTGTTINSTSMAAQTIYTGKLFLPITVTATGTGLGYQWYINTANSSTGGTSLSNNNGAQTSSYTPQTNKSGTFYYYCVVTGATACGVPQTTSVSGAFIVYFPPIVYSFSPASGAIGSSMTITGSNFNTSRAQDIVFFGATKATVTAATASSLTVTIPLGATYQYLSVTDLSTGLTAYSATPFNVTFVGNHIYAGKVDFATGSTPWSVSVGDLDGDGKPDLAVANSTASTVSVFRNTSTPGSVGFAAKVDLATGTYPYCVSIGDLDGDGKPDLAVANYVSSTVSVFLNTSTPGSINFAAKVDLPTGNSPWSVSIGDLDGDGRPDLAVANHDDMTVSVLLNTSTLGNLGFAAKVDLPTGAGPYSVSIGDLDGDGLPDLAVANYSDNTVSVLLNASTLGSISFAGNVDFPTGTNPASVSIGDLDGDGLADLAVANYGSATVSVLLNTSTPRNLAFAANVDLPTGVKPYSVSIGDLDGDGKPDLAVANFGSSTVSVLKNTSTQGNVGFAGKVDFITGSVPRSVIIGDIDGDGRPDMAVANKNGNSVSVIRQQSNALPVTFVGIGAVRKNTAVQVSFDVASQLNISVYDIERSQDGNIFTVVGSLPATGLGSFMIGYGYLDVSAPATALYYRVKSVGIGGETNYSAMASVAAVTEKAGFVISPNPVESSQINVQFKNQPSGRYSLRLVNNIGQSIFVGVLEHAGGNATQIVNLPFGIVRGTYQAELYCIDGTVGTQMILINIKN